ncbi:phage antirepressor N-terminal domain-containing protein [Providencia vermicola]|uniref:phage antirepressor N-terminal domain-containing protein n=1 Tax=Providencia vermicola TaxID=333965 RepID=UPI0034D52014
MSTISTINVPFHGDNLYLVNYEGQPFVAMRPFIEGMGLDWASQYTKIKQRFKTCVVNITMQLPCDNQRRSVVCLALKKLTGWLHTININKVKPEIREKVAAYQDRSDDVLYEYWTTGEVKAKKSTTTDDRAPLRNAVDCLMTKKRLSFPKAYGYVHAKYGVNSIDEVPLDLLPEAVDYIYKVALEGEYIPKQTERFVDCRVLHHYDDKGEIVKSEIATDDEQLTSPKVFADLAESRGYVMVKKSEVNATSITNSELSRLLVIRNRFDKGMELWKNNLCCNLIRMDVPSAIPFNQIITDALSELRVITDKISERLIA